MRIELLAVPGDAFLGSAELGRDLTGDPVVCDVLRSMWARFGAEKAGRYYADWSNGYVRTRLSTAAEKRDRQLHLATRAAGHDVTPGHEQGHHYWTRDPEGLARWAKSEHPFDTLVQQLVEHVKISPETAKRWANVWYHEVFGFYPGSDVARVKRGKPPRGDKIGPG